ncbi:MAG: GNVR domain-containing protein [Pseudomonadota bacterium]|nr:GNVR domain-containing protein [Pseudomonadota bacterium]
MPLIDAAIRQRRVFLSFCGASVLTALVVSLLAPRTYQAVALVQLLPRAGREMPAADVVEDGGSGYLEARDRARTQMQIILSRAVREEVVVRYNALGYDDLQLTVDALDRLGESMSVAPREDTQLVEIGVRHSNPERAALLANLVAEVYGTDTLAARTGAARQTRTWLDGQAETARAALVEETAKVMAFKQAHALIDIEEETDGISARMGALQAALGAATTERVLLQGKLEEHERLLDEGQTDALVGMFADATVETVAREHATVIAQTAEVLSRYGKRHPEYRLAVERRGRVKAVLAGAVSTCIDTERLQLETLLRQEQDIRGELALTKGDLLEKQRLQGEYAELELQEERARRLYASLGDRGAEVELQADSRLNDVRVIDRALPPRRPVSPNLALNLAVALGLGLVGGLGLAVLCERLRAGSAGPVAVDDVDPTPPDDWRARRVH